MPRKWFGSAVVTLYTLFIYPSVHNQLIRTLFEARHVALKILTMYRQGQKLYLEIKPNNIHDVTELASGLCYTQILQYQKIAFSMFINNMKFGDVL